MGYMVLLRMKIVSTKNSKLKAKNFGFIFEENLLIAKFIHTPTYFGYPICMFGDYGTIAQS